MYVIGITGKAHHGKNSLAKFLQRIALKHGFASTDIAFADKLKEVAKDLFFLTHEQVMTTEGKAMYIERFGMTAGEILQKFGTNVAREIHPDLWIMHVREKLKILNDKGFDLVFITDVRFPNEADFIREIGGVIVKVVRPNYVDPNRDPNHPSEAMVDKIKADDVVIAEDLKELKKEASRLFYDLFKIS